MFAEVSSTIQLIASQANTQHMSCGIKQSALETPYKVRKNYTYEQQQHLRMRGTESLQLRVVRFWCYTLNCEYLSGEESDKRATCTTGAVHSFTRWKKLNAFAEKL
jgi:hypothetical protein